MTLPTLTPQPKLQKMLAFRQIYVRIAVHSTHPKESLLDRFMLAPSPAVAARHPNNRRKAVIAGILYSGILNSV
jgi:hypothetical protein